MLRNLTVAQIPQGNGYVPSIRIAGKYLKQFNFNVHDLVNVICKPDEIIIKRSLSNEDKLKALIEKNPNLLTMIQKFDLELS